MADDTPKAKPDDTSKPDDSSGLAGYLAQEKATLDQYTKEGKELLEQRKKATEEAISGPGGLEALNKQYLDAAGKPIAMPRTPRLQQIPQAPQPKFEDPFNAFGNPLVIMASIGSLFTRTPAIAALNAGAAAMNAYHEGNKEKIELARQNFEDKLNTVRAQNQQEMDLYNAEMQKTRISLSEKMNNMSAIAHAFQNKEVIASFRNGDFDQGMKLIDGQMNAQNTMNQQWMHYQEFRERQDEVARYHQEQSALAQERIDEARERGAAAKTQERHQATEAARAQIDELKAGNPVTTAGGFTITPKMYNDRLKQTTPDIGQIPAHKAIDDMIKAASGYLPEGGGRHGPGPTQTPQMIPGAPIKIPDQVMKAMGGKVQDGTTFDIGPNKYQVQGDHAIYIGPSGAANPANVKPPAAVSPPQAANPYAGAAARGM